MPAGSFGAAGSPSVGGDSYRIFRLDAVDGAVRLPFSLKVLLENLLRNEDGRLVTAAQIQALAGWDTAAEPSAEIAFTPARVLLQDFTGVPCLVDLAAMREAMAALGGDPAAVSPLRPAELIIDHSVIADFFGRPDALVRNIDLRRHAAGGIAPVRRAGQYGRPVIQHLLQFGVPGHEPCPERAAPAGAWDVTVTPPFLPAVLPSQLHYLHTSSVVKTCLVCVRPPSQGSRH